MTYFGTTKRGHDVQSVTLSGHGLSVTILTLGAIVQDLRLDGIPHSLTIGSDDLADYETQMQYHGAIVGPVANRISGAKATIDGYEHQLERNFLGQHTLHGGTRGLHTRVWTIADQTTDSLTLSLTLPDGDFGLPGNRQMTAHYAISADATLTLSITTSTDEATVVNTTNHSYWCLDDSGTMANHRLQIHADSYLPTTQDVLPTGDIADVAATGFDFRSDKPLALGETPFDHTWPVAGKRRELTEILHLSAPVSTQTLTMTVATTEAGVHIYDDRPAYRALAIECQAWPDALMHPHFPSISLLPDAPVTQMTRWSFTRR